MCSLSELRIALALAAERGRERRSVLSKTGWRPSLADNPARRRTRARRSSVGGSRPAHVCPDFHVAVELVGRRWAGAILYALAERPHYFAELAQAVPGLSDRLSQPAPARARGRGARRALGPRRASGPRLLRADREGRRALAGAARAAVLGAALERSPRRSGT